jgi:hypothetical protein
LHCKTSVSRPISAQSLRLAADPPPYRLSPFPHSPWHVLVEFDGVAPA